MEYFYLFEKVENPIKILEIDKMLYQNNLSDENFQKLPSVSIGYTIYSPEMEIPDLLAKPMMLVSDSLKDLVSLYDETIQWKAIQVMPQEEKLVSSAAPLYWAGSYPVQNCVHKDTIFYQDGRINKLILDKNRMRHHDIFRVGGILETRIVISLKLAESILRRPFYGIGLKTVEIQ